MKIIISIILLHQILLEIPPFTSVGVVPTYVRNDKSLKQSTYFSAEKGRQDMQSQDGQPYVLHLVLQGSGSKLWPTHGTSGIMNGFSTTGCCADEQHVGWKAPTLSVGMTGDAIRNKKTNALQQEKMVTKDPPYRLRSYIGPGGFDVIKFNVLGRNTIDQQWQSALSDCDKQLPDAIEKYIPKEFNSKTDKPILIKIIGWSRGAVGAAILAKRLVKTSQFKDNINNGKIRVEVVLFDPVPGFDHEIKDGKESEYMKITMPYIVEATVIYSLNVGWLKSNRILGVAPMFPQIIKNADRQIFGTKQQHNPGCEDWFSRPTQGKAFRGSGFNHLEKGAQFAEFQTQPEDKPRKNDSHTEEFWHVLKRICSSDNKDPLDVGLVSKNWGEFRVHMHQLVGRSTNDLNRRKFFTELFTALSETITDDIENDHTQIKCLKYVFNDFITAYSPFLDNYVAQEKTNDDNNDKSLLGKVESGIKSGVKSVESVGSSIISGISSILKFKKNEKKVLRS